MKLKTFGDRLNWARRNHVRITQIELRNKMEENHGVSIGANYISELETGKEDKRPSFEVVSAMAAVLKVSLDFLAGFTENHTPVQGESLTPHFISPEADEVGQLVDSVRPDQRTLIVAMARNVAALPTLKQRDEAEYDDLLDSVQRQMGTKARDEVAEIIRRKRLPVNPAS